MQAIHNKLTNILTGPKQFVIPVFQRDYSWSDENCERLWRDIVQVGSGQPNAHHFVGSLVYIASDVTSAGMPRWLLIDGQQRVTTVTLLMAALRDAIEARKWQSVSDDGPTAKKIDGYFLKNELETKDLRYKLRLRRNDDGALRAIIDRDITAAHAVTRIAENYEFFRDRLEDADLDAIYRGIGRLVVVDVTLSRGLDEPQAIFESLNSTGVDLSQSDLIRNYILMRLPEPEQTDHYERHWKPIEDLFVGADRAFDSFARDYMLLRTEGTQQARADQVYRYFRTFFDDEREKCGLDEAFNEMRRYARYYAAFLLDREAPASIRASLGRLRKLAEVAAVLVMRLCDCHERLRTLTEREFVEALDTLESYVFRRAVCGLQTRGYGPAFASLARRLDANSPLLSLRVMLARQPESYRFPSDDEFRRELESRDIYAMRTCRFLLDRLENYENKESEQTDNYSIEHVLPQNANVPKAWREMLGPHWKSLHAEWVHRLGNLTLTGYNSDYQDRPFEEKKTIKGGFSESAVRLNREIREQPTWAAAEIEARGRRLAAQALKIWMPLVVDLHEQQAAERAELEKRARLRSLEAVEMTEAARSLFVALRTQVMALHSHVIEVPEQRSVAYHAPDGDFFVEVLPRKRRLVLLVNLDHAECEYRDEYVSDATQWEFFFHAQHEAGTTYKLNDLLQIESAMKVVRQAFQLAAR